MGTGSTLVTLCLGSAPLSALGGWGVPASGYTMQSLSVHLLELKKKIIWGLHTNSQVQCTEFLGSLLKCRFLGTPHMSKGRRICLINQPSRQHPSLHSGNATLVAGSYSALPPGCRQLTASGPCAWAPRNSSIGLTHASNGEMASATCPCTFRCPPKAVLLRGASFPSFPVSPGGTGCFWSQTA